VYGGVENEVNSWLFKESSRFRLGPKYKSAATLKVSEYPQGLAFDHSGNLYVADYTFGTIEEFGPSGNPINASFASGLNGPVGLAFDGSGNLFVANQNNNTVSEFGPAGNLINPTFASGLNTPRGLAFDGSDNLYVANEGNNTVSEFGPSGNLINASFAPGLYLPTFIAFSVPEPSTWVLVGMGSVGLLCFRRKNS
jgi:DNA-binding beta-propeller fold protein YncE